MPSLFRKISAPSHVRENTLPAYTKNRPPRQELLCRENCDWDNPIPDRLNNNWERWCQELPILEDHKIRRCYKPEVFKGIARVEIQHFSYASQSGNVNTAIYA